MEEYESAQYERFLSEVGKEISSLRVILESVEATAKERTWLSYQTSGDFDERRIIEGVTGEKNIFRRRGELPYATFHFSQELPKRIRFVMDISGSMFRFDGQDQRLQRLLQSTLMILEAFRGFEHKYQISIVGHSGDSEEIPLVDYGALPKDRKTQWKILQRMTIHAEYCTNGDLTVEAIQKAIANVLREEADDYFVFAVSDANWRRHGIQTEKISQALLENPKVNVFVIFIASLGEEAEHIQPLLPLGKSFLCLNTEKLPGLFQQMFSLSSMLHYLT